MVHIIWSILYDSYKIVHNIWFILYGLYRINSEIDLNSRREWIPNQWLQQDRIRCILHWLWLSFSKTFDNQYVQTCNAKWNIWINFKTSDMFEILLGRCRCKKLSHVNIISSRPFYRHFVHKLFYAIYRIFSEIISYLINMVLGNDKLIP